ncbi:probable WRKY transcription factor 53 [Impatiens glandulifera]|uniref:probable WRKY transcription factor 53 n=1 Tax=Impatiens glandulifera TaxID=253017 RepID=UPI001FB13E69|nr:probable WRKY transcription factor 53 [Impatiens glandulifera]
MELVKELGFHLNYNNIDETQKKLLERILSTYEKSLFILQWRNVANCPQLTAAGATAVPPETSSPSPDDSSPRSDDVSDRTADVNVSKKRKGQPVWTNQVRIRSENGLEGQIGDGYSWRKYGQKDILGAKYPRSYYRCTYRSVHDCWATKHLQRSDADPCVFDITYRGNHNCCVINPDQQQQSTNNSTTDLLENHKASLRVNVTTLDNNNNNDHIIFGDHFTFPSTLSLGYKPDNDTNFNFSSMNDGDLSRVFSPAPTYISPHASSSSYFTREIRNFAVSDDIQHHSESNLTKGLDFSSLEGLEHGQEENIQFDNAGFFASYGKTIN